MQKLLTAAFALVILSCASAHACATYQRLPDSQILETDKVLRDTKASTTQRIVAYGILACSDNPSIRDETIRAAIAAGNPDGLRGRALLDRLGSMSGYIIDVGPVTNPDPTTKKILERTHGAVKLDNRFFDETKGCVSFNSNNSCSQSLLMNIRGTHVEIDHSTFQIVGQFDLDPAGHLSGRIKFGNSAFVPAQILLK
jgi:hypothetical protein